VEGGAGESAPGRFRRGAKSVPLRVTDAAFNGTTFDLKPELEP